jgi:hypothetical protein
MLRIISALPDWFELAGIAARNAAARIEFETYGFKTFDSVKNLAINGQPDFIVTAVFAGDAQPIIQELARFDVPVLTETPAGGTLDELEKLYQLVKAGARIQTAEQYHLEPLIAAQIAVAQSDIFGEITDAHINVAHDYHGISVMRRALGVRFGEPVITARNDARKIFPSPTRYADPADVSLAHTTRTSAWFDYQEQGKLGIYEFDDAQYRSWVRSPSLTISGPLGQVRDDIVQVVSGDPLPHPVSGRLLRIDAGGAGSHEGLFLRGYQLFGEWAYHNPFRPARLADDELAIAHVFATMGDYVVNEGREPYPVADAAQDQYLSIMMKQAIAGGKPVRTTRQVWAE